MAAISSQLWCSSYSIHGRLHLNSPSYPCPNLPRKALIIMCHDGHNTRFPGFEKRAILSYREDALNSHNERSRKPYSTTEENVNGRWISEPAEHVSSEQKRCHNAVLLHLCGDVRRKPTAEEVEAIPYSLFIIGTSAFLSVAFVLYRLRGHTKHPPSDAHRLFPLNTTLSDRTPTQNS
ncbi:hypothetical protein LguiA_014385 [Lonicera macranthoides]